MSMDLENRIQTNEQLVLRIRSGDNKSENMLQLWKQNKGFIAMMARRYSAGAEMEDLEQEGYIGLCEAVRNYDPARGMSFISYVAFYIKRRMRICADNSRAVRLSFNAGDEVRQYQKLVREYRQECGCEPSDRELCSLLCISREKLDQIRKAAQMGNIRSLDEPVQGLEGDINIGDTVPSGEDMEEDAIRRLDKERMSRELWLAVDQLPGDLPAAVHLRYENGLTLEKTGQALGVNKERARQLESKALRMLRLPHRCKRFRVYHEEYISAAPISHTGLNNFKTTWWSETERLAIME